MSTEKCNVTNYWRPKMKSIYTLGDRIKQVRKEKDMTQADFAEILSISRPFVSRIESGKEIPSDSIIKLICSICGINYLWLKEGTGHKYKNINSFFRANFETINEKSGLIGTRSVDYAYCSSIILKLLSNNNIKDNSDQYYLTHIRSLLFHLDHLLSLDEDSLKNVYVDLYKPIMEHIEQDIYGALDALREENLNDRIKEPEIIYETNEET